MTVEDVLKEQLRTVRALVLVFYVYAHGIALLALAGCAWIWAVRMDSPLVPDANPISPTSVVVLATGAVLAGGGLYWWRLAHTPRLPDTVSWRIHGMLFAEYLALLGLGIIAGGDLGNLIIDVAGGPVIVIAALSEQVRPAVQMAFTGIAVSVLALGVAPALGVDGFLIHQPRAIWPLMVVLPLVLAMPANLVGQLREQTERQRAWALELTELRGKEEHDALLARETLRNVFDYLHNDVLTWGNRVATRLREASASSRVPAANLGTAIRDLTAYLDDEDGPVRLRLKEVRMYRKLARGKDSDPAELGMSLSDPDATGLDEPEHVSAAQVRTWINNDRHEIPMTSPGRLLRVIVPRRPREASVPPRQFASRGKRLRVVNLTLLVDATWRLLVEQWLRLRVLWVAVLAVWGIWVAQDAPRTESLLMAEVAVLIAYVAATTWWWGWRPDPGYIFTHPRRASYLDTAAIAGLIVFGGGVDSPFIYMAAWPVALCGITYGTRGIITSTAVMVTAMGVAAASWAAAGYTPFYETSTVSRRALEAQGGLILISLVVWTILYTLTGLKRVERLQDKAFAMQLQDRFARTIHGAVRAREHTHSTIRDLQAFTRRLRDVSRGRGGPEWVALAEALQEVPVQVDGSPQVAPWTVGDLSRMLEGIFQRSARHSDEHQIYRFQEDIPLGWEFVVHPYPASEEMVPLPPRGFEPLRRYCESAIHNMLEHGEEPYRIRFEATQGDPMPQGCEYTITFINGLGEPAPLDAAAPAPGDGRAGMRATAEQHLGGSSTEGWAADRTEWHATLTFGYQLGARRRGGQEHDDGDGSARGERPTGTVAAAT